MHVSRFVFVGSVELQRSGTIVIVAGSDNFLFFEIYFHFCVRIVSFRKIGRTRQDYFQNSGTQLLKKRTSKTEKLPT